MLVKVKKLFTGSFGSSLPGSSRPSCNERDLESFHGRSRMPLAARLRCRPSGNGVGIWKPISECCLLYTAGHVPPGSPAARYTVFGPSVYRTWADIGTRSCWVTGFFWYPQPQKLAELLVCEWNIANHCPSSDTSCVFPFFPPDLPKLNSTSIQVQHQPAIVVLLAVSSSRQFPPITILQKCCQEV